MDIKGYFKKGVAMARLKGEAAEEVAADPDSFVPAMVVFAVPFLVSGISTAILAARRMGLNDTALFGMIVAVVMLSVFGPVINAGVLHLISKLFKGEGKYLDYYQTLGIGSLVGWGSVLPFVGFIFGLWQIPVAVVVTSKVQKLSTRKAVLVVLLPVALMLVLVVMVMSMGIMAALYETAGKAAFQMRR